MQLTDRQNNTRRPARGRPSRRELLDAANKAMGRGRVKAALGAYLRTMEHHGPDPTIDAKVAALYARLRRITRARAHFVSASTQFLSAGFDEKALAVYKSAVSCLPTQLDVWQELVDLQRSQGRTADAVHTLMAARKYFKGRAFQQQRTRLLQQVLELEPGNAQAKLELAVLFSRQGRPVEAREALEALVPHARGSRLRRVRGALFRLSPTPAAAWRWLRAALFGC
jgi:tetratricopeptide (TPR) repeat protein